MITKFTISLSVFLLWTVIAYGAMAAERVALVIGNANYHHAGVLRNPLNDATDVAAVLRNLGFSVYQQLDGDREQMETAVADYARNLRDAEIGLFYYAGHGMQVDGRNYLLPIDIDPESEQQVRYRSMDVSYVLGEMNTSKVALKIVILDACRNNPFRFSRSASRGLARQDSPGGTLISYSAAPGQVAEDGTGRNGTFTEHLLTHLSQPGLGLTDLFNRVGWSVKQATSGRQEPWLSTSPMPPFCLAGCQTARVAPSPPVTPAEQQPPDSKTYLTIKPTPLNARVRIMNIAPRYRDGIELPQGRYDIEVSAKGYQRYRQQHSLAPGEQVLAIELERLTTPPPRPPKSSTSTPDSGMIEHSQSDSQKTSCRKFNGKCLEFNN